MVASDDTPSVARLAQRLGISDRHLRRIFLAEHGVTPLQHLQTRRLLLAKQLLTDSRMPVSQVALASGFASLRRFNAAFAQAYRMSPSRLRGGELAREAGDGAIQVTLSYRAPLDRDSLLRFLARRAVPGVEAIVGARVRRSVRAQVLAPDAGWLEVEFTARPEVATPAPAGKIQLRFAPAWARSSAAVVAAVRRWLDLDAEPVAIDSTLADLPGAPGLRLPGSLDGFESAVRAILGQQVTVAAARTLAARLVDRFGLPLSSPWPELSRCFPAPAALASLAPATLSELGVMPARSAALIALARVWPDIEARIRSQCPGELITHLRSLPGIGPWTAQYIAMRVLSWPDAFPPGDVAALQAMRRLFGDMTPGQAQRRAQDWQPWRSYAVLRLWNSLDQEHP
jgi:AraC family transcriptional regulator of adaptative response / DNA-3-methyladenine glycosylase II